MKVNTHFKETTPEKTVAKLKGILNDMGILVEENWQKKSAIDTYSLRVTFKGTNIGTNGKGVDKIYAEASAYAEFFERYQNLIINSLPEADNHEKCGFFVAPDEKVLSTEELLTQNDPFFANYFKVNKQEEMTLEEKVNAFLNVNITDETAYELHNKFVSLPFYSVKDNKLYYLPKSTMRVMYGSNGMCAGNTPAEAIVQGISEIFERVSQRRILFEKPNLPDVPEEYIKKYPDIYKMYKKLQSIDGYYVTMKDCSFGGKYPVAGLLIVEKNTGHYGIKLGCHPDFGIAMERTFTEATQGGDIDEYANRSTIDFSNSNVTSLYNISNSFTVGFAQYPYEILNGNTNEFVPVPDVSNFTNKQILDKWINNILKDGYDVLIRDVSTLGFPSFHVIIPGLTEMDAGDSMMRARNTRAYVTKTLIKPSKLEIEDVKYILGVISYTILCFNLYSLMNQGIQN